MTTSGIRKLPAGIISDTGDVDGDTYGDIVIGARWDADVPGSQKGGVSRSSTARQAAPSATWRADTCH
ncbi:hypothetical protein [Streptomyces sp. NPDC002346]